MSDPKQNPAEEPEELNDEQLEEVAGGIDGGGCIEPFPYPGFPPIIQPTPTLPPGTETW